MQKNFDQPGLKILGEALKKEISCRVKLANYTKSGMECHICITMSRLDFKSYECIKETYYSGYVPTYIIPAF